MLILVAGIVTWCLVPPLNYKARTQLHISLDPPNILFPENRPIIDDAFPRKQMYLIHDPFVLKAVQRNHPEMAKFTLFKEQPDPVQWLEQEIKVEFPDEEFMWSH
jgi:hypothetical protein